MISHHKFLEISFLLKKISPCSKGKEMKENSMRKMKIMFFFVF